MAAEAGVEVVAAAADPEFHASGMDVAEMACRAAPNARWPLPALGFLPRMRGYHHGTLVDATACRSA